MIRFVPNLAFFLHLEQDQIEPDAFLTLFRILFIRPLKSYATFVERRIKIPGESSSAVKDFPLVQKSRDGLCWMSRVTDSSHKTSVATDYPVLWETATVKGNLV